MCEPTTIGLALAAASATATVYQGEQARKAQHQAADKARETADQQFNAANPKRPNSSALADANKMAASGGAGSTMLTSPAGVDPSSLLLGKSTLLGG